MLIVNRTRSFLDAAQKEKLMEREAMSSGMMFDQLMEMMQVQLNTYTCTTPVLVYVVNC